MKYLVKVKRKSTRQPGGKVRETLYSLKQHFTTQTKIQTLSWPHVRYGKITTLWTSSTETPTKAERSKKMMQLKNIRKDTHKFKNIQKRGPSLQLITTKRSTTKASMHISISTQLRTTPSLRPWKMTALWTGKCPTPIQSVHPITWPTMIIL